MLGDDIAAVLAVDGSPAGGLTAAELADWLGVPVGEVSFALFAGHGRFRRDAGAPARWRVAPGPVLSAQRAPASRTPALPCRRSVPSASLGLYAWQADALRAWEEHGCRGVVEAVTGTGKTMVGIAAVLDELARGGQAVVLVPTIELQHQWVAQLQPFLPSRREVGRMGAGASASLLTHDVLVALVNTARATDMRLTRRGGLLVADECHRYGSAVNHLALDPRFRRRLGLSATYAREDDGNLAWLEPYFGGTCFRLGYERAVADGIVAHFTVALVGVQFSPEEEVLYRELTGRMVACRAALVGMYEVPEEPFEEFMRALAALADGESAGSGAARAYRTAMLERRRLLADTPAKDSALGRLAPAVRAADRAIVFTRSVDAAERARMVLSRYGLRAATVHSELTTRDRREVLGRFAGGQLDLIAAPRVLDEGIDVPAADLAVIVGASRSRRQMVQRMGRVLRRKPDGRWARFAVVFVEGTVEDPAYGAHEAFLGEIVAVAERVTCFPAAGTAWQDAALLADLRPRGEQLG